MLINMLTGKHLKALESFKWQKGSLMTRKNIKILLSKDRRVFADVQLISTLLGVFKVSNIKIPTRQILRHKTGMYPLSILPVKRGLEEKLHKKLCILHHKCFHWYLLHKLVPQKSSSSSIYAPGLHKLCVLGCSICRRRGKANVQHSLSTTSFTMDYAFLILQAEF